MGLALIAKHLALIAASIVGPCLAMEAFLRLAMPQNFEPHPPGMYETDPQMGYVLAAGFNGSLDRPEFRTTVHINKSGLRGPDLRPRKRNTVRILALGDSFTWGWGTNADAAWPAVTERLLSERYPSLDIQVLNAGTPGYGTDQELALLESKGVTLQPDLVITMLFANDFLDNRQLARTTYTTRDGMLVEPAVARPGWLRAVKWMKTRSHLVTFVSERAGYLAARLGFLSYIEQPLSDYFTPEDARRALELLGGISNVTRRLCAQSLFVFAPEKMQVLSDGTSALRAANVVAQAAQTAGAPWVNLAIPIVEATNKTELYYKADPHWTPAGQRLAAQVIADKILEVGLKPAGAGCLDQDPVTQ